MFDRPDQILARLKAPLLLAAAMLGLWFAAQALLYRSGTYYALAEPDSNTGAMVNARLLLQREYAPGKRNVLVFGDSRIGEGFSAKLAEQHGGEVNFVNLAVPGSTTRTWYYLLRRIVRDGYAFDAVLVGTLYQPRDAMRLAEWPLDPAHQIPLLDLADLRDYPDAFESEPMRERARRTLLLPALAMQQDTRAALAAPLERAHKLLRSRPGFLAAVPEYAGREARMPELTLDRAGAVLDWRDANATERATVESHLAELRAPADPDIAASNRAYAARWLGGMAELAAQRGARLILFQLPRGPYHALQPPHPDDAAALAALHGHDRATALPADLLDELEQPQFFFDALHLNRAGRERMSALLGQRVPPLLRDGAH
jgi:hypothetical protein